MGGPCGFRIPMTPPVCARGAPKRRPSMHGANYMLSYLLTSKTKENAPFLKNKRHKSSKRGCLKFLFCTTTRRQKGCSSLERCARGGAAKKPGSAGDSGSPSGQRAVVRTDTYCLLC